MKKFDKILKILQNLFFLYKNKGIAIISYPKSGSTIFRMREMLISDGNLPLGHKSVNTGSLEIGKGYLRESSYLYKTHRVVYRIFFNSRSVYMIREPFESLASHFMYLKRNDIIKMDTTFTEFFESRYGYRWYIYHLRLFENKRSNNIYIYYEDYVENPIYYHLALGSMRGEKRGKDVLTKIVAKTSRSAMNSAESSEEDSQFSKTKDYTRVAEQIDEGQLKRIHDLQIRYGKSKK